MKHAFRALSFVCILTAASALLAYQGLQFRPYHRDQVSNEVKAEFAFARLRYPTHNVQYGGFGGFGSFRPNGGWSEDYPKSDRQFTEGVVRLTRLDARPYEEVLDPDSDEMFNWPWIYAVNVADWDFNAEQAKRMRDYLLKGGFLVVDSFHGAVEWASFMRGMNEILPNRPVENLSNDDPVFHVLYDLTERFQIPGYQYMLTGRTYERDGFDPQWRAIRDEKGRILVMIGFNMHIGDAWEHADEPLWPERFSSLAYRLGINYIIYGMTH
jgi:Domain of unknown function (DUF4159)